MKNIATTVTSSTVQTFAPTVSSGIHENEEIRATPGVTQVTTVVSVPITTTEHTESHAETPKLHDND